LGRLQYAAQLDEIVPVSAARRFRASFHRAVCAAEVKKSSPRQNSDTIQTNILQRHYNCVQQVAGNILRAS
jgi:hypothetical protein